MARQGEVHFLSVKLTSHSFSAFVLTRLYTCTQVQTVPHIGNPIWREGGVIENVISSAVIIKNTLNTLDYKGQHLGFPFTMKFSYDICYEFPMRSIKDNIDFLH